MEGKDSQRLHHAVCKDSELFFQILASRYTARVRFHPGSIFDFSPEGLQSGLVAFNLPLIFISQFTEQVLSPFQLCLSGRNTTVDRTWARLEAMNEMKQKWKLTAHTDASRSPHDGEKGRLTILHVR